MQTVYWKSTAAMYRRDMSNLGKRVCKKQGAQSPRMMLDL